MTPSGSVAISSSVGVLVGDAIARSVTPMTRSTAQWAAATTVVRVATSTIATYLAAPDGDKVRASTAVAIASFVAGIAGSMTPSFAPFALPTALSLLVVPATAAAAVRDAPAPSEANPRLANPTRPSLLPDHVDPDTFAERVINPSHDRPVILDVYIDGCPSCDKSSGPLAKACAAQGWELRKVHAHQQRELADELQVEAYPSLIIFSEGEPRGFQAGWADEEQFVQWVEDSLGADES